MASKRILGAIPRVSAPVASSSRIAPRLLSTKTEAQPQPTSGMSQPGFLDFPPVKPLKAKHGVHVATLHLRSHEHTWLELYSQFALQAARSLKIPTSGVARLPTTKELVTVIKSHFVFKKTQENFASYTHKRAIKVFDADKEALDLLLRYLKKNGMGGIGVKAYIHEYVEHGFAAGELAEVEGMLAGVPESDVEAAAADIIKSLMGGLEFEDASASKAKVVKEELVVAAKVEEPAAPSAEAEAAQAEQPAEQPTEPKA